MIPWRSTPPHLARVSPALKSALLLVALMAALWVLAGCSDDEFKSQGSASNPVDLGTAPISAYAGSIGPDASSYYSVTVTNPTQYSVSLYQMTDDADLAVYESSFSGATFCASINNGTTNESCSAITNTGVTGLYIQIKPFSENGTDFLLTVAILGSAPSAPTGVVATAGTLQVSVNWTSVSGASSYNIYMATVTGVTAANYAGLTGGAAHIGVTSPHTITGLTSNTYFFIVTAVNTIGEGAASSEVSALVP